MFGALFWAGFALIAIGGTLVGMILSRHGGLERARTLSVVFSDDSPMRAVPGDRTKFRVGVFVIGFGMINVFSALSVGEGREQRVCGDLCRLSGHGSGRFAPSEIDKDAAGAPLRACWCATPTGSIELRPARPPTP